MPLTDKTFIETQFPISLISKESYKERKANLGQTLTGLGKWWGRKPLILIRASILGMLMPVSDNPQKDRDIFLKILTMDKEGLWQRRSKSISVKVLHEWLPNYEAELLFDINEKGSVRWKKDVDVIRKEVITQRYFDCLSYDEKLEYCVRPEQITGPNEEAWLLINDHLGTSAKNIQQLIDQLGKDRFGHTPKVGDAFCGGGSIPFEAARMGCDAYGSDLNPAAALLTWASINLIGGGKEVQEKVKNSQQSAFEAVDKQVVEWGIEHNNKGWRADAYLYCVEAICPSTGYLLPLSPSWVISEKHKVCAVLKADSDLKRYDIEIVVGADQETFSKAKLGTVQKGRMVCPETGETYAISSIRGDKRVEGKTVYGLRLWDNEDLVPQQGDIFQERLYCVRWAERYWTTNSQGKKVEKIRQHYCSVTKDDLRREREVLKLLQGRFIGWQDKGFVPSRKIERGGDKTEEPIRNRGWSYWHHLFTPRQLLISGLLQEKAFSENRYIAVTSFLGIAKMANWNSRLCAWMPHAGNQKGDHTFINQALNTLYNFSVRPLTKIQNTWLSSVEYKTFPIVGNNQVVTSDARDINLTQDIWITDPPYADAINYHELGTYFTSWYEKNLSNIFSDWTTVSRTALAVKGTGDGFKHAMVDVYKNLAFHMPSNGLQMVQFTHQDPSVWADLGMILWVSGLKVSAAWTIATETSSGYKKGNYVQGTVLLVLRKRTIDDVVFPDELPDMIEDEVCLQLDEMIALDDKDEPNFGDTDYQLAAYAAALRVMTQFSSIEGINIENELYREKQKGQKSEFEKLIDQAVETACNYLIPTGFDEFQWKRLSASERFYLKGLELEKHGELRAGAYQELAKGFGIREYTFMYANTKANEVRFKTATEFKRANLRGDGFSGSVMRHILFALHETVKTETAKEGLNYLRSEINDYWGQRKKIAEILRYLNRLHHVDHMPHWEVDSEVAATLAGAVDNDFS